MLCTATLGTRVVSTHSKPTPSTKEDGELRWYEWYLITLPQWSPPLLESSLTSSDQVQKVASWHAKVHETKGTKQSNIPKFLNFIHLLIKMLKSH